MHVDLVFVLEGNRRKRTARRIGANDETLLDGGAGAASIETHEPGLARQARKCLRQARDAHIVAKFAGQVPLESHSVHHCSRQLIAPAARNSAIRSPGTPQRANAVSVSAPGMGGGRERPAGETQKGGGGGGCQMHPAAEKL